MFDQLRKKKKYTYHKPTTKHKMTYIAKQKKLDINLKYNSSTKSIPLLSQIPQWQHDIPLEHEHVKKYSNAANRLSVTLGLVQLLAYTMSTAANPIGFVA